MQRLSYLTAAFVSAIMIMPGAGSAHMVEANGVQVIHPWVEASSADRTRGVPTIANDNDHTIVLVGVTTPVADAVSIVRHGVAVDQVEIVPGDVTDPESLHLEMTGLGEPLREGDDFKATLHFAEGDPIEIDFVVGETTMMSPEMVMPAAMKH